MCATKKAIGVLGMLISLAFLAAGPAYAESAKDVTVRAGRTTAVHGFIYYLLGSCSTALAVEPSIRTAPQHGTTKFIRKQTVRPKDATHCPGRKVTAHYVLYTPKRGYRGPDSLVVDYRYHANVVTARMVTRSFAVNITVK
ncbi:MAG: hypothetical protein C0606_16550 [Hyphomicrobiales bacterium]|nr:MAG: hypothetical protein C0606_16550 [Hyphomicrobiales bacterium]